MNVFRIFRPRGWLLLAAGLLALLLASVLGRRDLLTVAIFCFVLPAVAYASLHFFKPGFTLKRTLSPRLGRVGTPVEVTLQVHGRNPAGSQSLLREQLPFSFRLSPTFNHPQPVAPKSRRSDYHYTLHPGHRGVFTVGPLTGTFTDPFDVAALERGLDDGDKLTIAPAALALPLISMTEGRGLDGSLATAELAHSRQDDVMTRDYRYGDSLRRVHWPVTARQGKLMVRDEESVTTPEAVVVLDRRHTAFGAPGRSMELFQIAGRTTTGLPELVTTVGFENAVVAASSIAAHLLEHNFTVTLLDHRADPALLNSASAPDPARDLFAGTQGELDIAAGLAAVELAPVGETTLSTNLAERLHGGERRGPLVAVLGTLTEAEALLLAGRSDSVQHAYALLLCQNREEAGPTAHILRRAGWRVALLTPATTLLAAWADLDAPAAVGGGGS